MSDTTATAAPAAAPKTAPEPNSYVLYLMALFLSYPFRFEVLDGGYEPNLDKYAETNLAEAFSKTYNEDNIKDFFAKFAKLHPEYDYTGIPADACKKFMSAFAEYLSLDYWIDYRGGITPAAATPKLQQLFKEDVMRKMYVTLRVLHPTTSYRSMATIFQGTYAWYLGVERFLIEHEKRHPEHNFTNVLERNPTKFNNLFMDAINKFVEEERLTRKH